MRWSPNLKEEERKGKGKYSGPSVRPLKNPKAGDPNKLRSRTTLLNFCQALVHLRQSQGCLTSPHKKEPADLHQPTSWLGR